MKSDTLLCAVLQRHPVILREVVHDVLIACADHVWAQSYGGHQ